MKSEETIEKRQLFDAVADLFDFNTTSVKSDKKSKECSRNTHTQSNCPDEIYFKELADGSKEFDSVDNKFYFSSPEYYASIKEQSFQDEQHYLPDDKRELYLQKIKKSFGFNAKIRNEIIQQVISEITADVALNVRYLVPMYLGKSLPEIRDQSDKVHKKYQWFQKKLGVNQLINNDKYTLPTPNSMPHKWTYTYAKSQGKNALEWITDSQGLGRFLKSGGAKDNVLYQDQLCSLDEEGLLALRNYFTSKGKGAADIAKIIPIKTKREEEEANRLLIQDRGLILAREATKITNSKNVRDSRK